MPVGYELHSMVREQSQKGGFVSILWGWIAAAPTLEHWIGLDPRFPQDTSDRGLV